jgi:hypothetical protein
MRPLRPRPARVGFSATVLAFVIVGILLNVPVPAKAAPASQIAATPAAGGRSYTVTWNGVDVSTASTASSALTIDFSQAANLVFSWAPLPAGPGGAVTINDARLQMFYFGFAVSTRDQTIAPPNSNASGSIPLSWTPLSINYVLEGVYRLTASFVAPNGTTMWSENFYVRGNAPLGFVAVIPIVLLLIAVYEVYGLVRSGRYAALGRKKEGAPPETPAQPPSTEAETPAETTEEAPAPAAESPPPSGGTS